MFKKIRIKPDHIKRGVIYAYACPIALALKDAFNDSSLDVAVFHCGIRIAGGNRRYYWMKLPYSARKFIDKYDNHVEVKPSTFYLNLPKELIKRMEKSNAQEN